MTITFSVSPVENTAHKGAVFSDIKNILRKEKCYKKNAGGEILQTSQQGSNVDLCDPRWSNSFIGTVFKAYCDHHDLVLRPDDIWLAILTQFSAYVNANAEKLRSKFVSHEGQQELIVVQMSTLRTADYGKMALEITDVIQKHLVDGGVREWILPSFTTTKPTDVIVASVVMMALLKAYFKYTCMLMCGIPKITLLGEPKDWEDIRMRVEKLPQYDLTDRIMTKWKDMLLPILDQFIDASRGKPDADFWTKICHREGGGSGPSYLSGWITIFTAFDDDGKWRGKCANQNGWLKIETSVISCGMVHVPVKIDDNGIEYQSEMFAGHITSELHNGGCQMQPRLDWAIALVDNDIPQKLDPLERISMFQQSIKQKSQTRTIEKSPLKLNEEKNSQKKYMEYWREKSKYTPFQYILDNPESPWDWKYISVSATKERLLAHPHLPWDFSEITKEKIFDLMGHPITKSLGTRFD
jgi:hypothetical protein